MCFFLNKKQGWRKIVWLCHIALVVEGGVEQKEMMKLCCTVRFLNANTDISSHHGRQCILELLDIWVSVQPGVIQKISQCTDIF